jgi:MYXO-CTERM domain-containing protein
MIKAILPALAAFTCQGLPAGDITSPYYWGDFMLDKYADELVVGELEPGPEPLEEPRAVLLITGVTIPQAWFGPIVARLERDGFRPVIWEPPALLSGSLFEASEMLADVVDQVRAESGQDKIDILAECTGGVIARHYVQSLGGDAYVNRLVTFVSPQAGLPKAKYAAKIAGWPALYDLTPGSEFLQAVASVPLPPRVQMTSIYTCTDEYIQPYSTSIVPGATNIGLCDGTFVGHFQTFYDPDIYLIMHAALTDGDDADDPAGDGDGKADQTGDEEDGAGGDEAAVGCSTSSGSTSALFALGIAGAFLALRRRRRR